MLADESVPAGHPPIDPVQARLWSALGQRSMDIDELFDRTRVARAEGAAALLALELDGRIARLPGNTVRRVPPRRQRNRAPCEGYQQG
jgi:predicted Rossmann fold nucleotide-binding protein DprA/Smf involved in DNA uptake